MKSLINLENINLIDLTHSLSSDIPQWDSVCGFSAEITCDYSDCKEEVKFRVQKIQMAAGIGTHMDAPLHCIPNGKSIADIALENLVAPCVVLDVSEKSHEHYQLSVADITQFEKLHGAIPANSFVIVYTGWGKYWPDKNKYRNNLQFPSVSKQAAQYLLSKNILGIGIDTLSPDTVDSGFPVHQLILGNNKYIVENIANADALPVIGSFVMILPLKIANGTEAPIRLIAMTAK